MFDSPVPVRVRSAWLAKHLPGRLAVHGREIVSLRSPSELGVLPQLAGVCVVDDGALVDSATREALRGPGAASVAVGILVLTSDPGRSPGRWLGGPVELCPVPSELSSIDPRLRALRLRTWQHRVATRIRKAKHLPAVLQEALAVVVQQQVSVPTLGEGAPLLRSVPEVAGRLGVRREYLSRQATAKGLPLHAVAESFVATLVLIEAQLSGTSFDDLSTHLGYAWASGLSAMIKRATGRTFSASKRTPPMELLDRWEASVLEPILYPPEAPPLD